MSKILAVAAALASLLAGGCSPPAADDGRWQYAGGMDGDVIVFVAVQPAAAMDGAVYQDAVKKLCRPGICFQVGFFVAGDPVPSFGSRSAFFDAGGWDRYRPLAIYTRNQFTKWDCERAGDEAAPLDALCGEGVKEQFGAVLDLAGRDGWGTGCGLPPFGGDALVRRYAADLAPARRDQMLGAYQRHLASSSKGPDSRSDCQRLKPNVERKAAQAKAILEAAIAVR